MQATVRAFDPLTQSGSVLTDHGVELTFDAAAFATAGVRTLRSGQRVRCSYDDGAAGVHALTIVTLAAPQVP